MPDSPKNAPYYEEPFSAWSRVRSAVHGRYWPSCASIHGNPQLNTIKIKRDTLVIALRYPQEYYYYRAILLHHWYQRANQLAFRYYALDEDIK